jgi:hypothetical protein
MRYGAMPGRRGPRMPLRARLRGLYRQHTYEATWWASWMLLALAWALWSVTR